MHNRFLRKHLTPAFSTAYRIALNGNPPRHKKIRYLKKQSKPVVKDESVYQKNYQDYVGDYRRFVVVKEGNSLYIICGQKIRLWPKTVDQFTADHFHSVQFLRDSNGRVKKQSRYGMTRSPWKNLEDCETPMRGCRTT